MSRRAASSSGGGSIPDRQVCLCGTSNTVLTEAESWACAADGGHWLCSRCLLQSKRCSQHPRCPRPTFTGSLWHRTTFPKTGTKLWCPWIKSVKYTTSTYDNLVRSAYKGDINLRLRRSDKDRPLIEVVRALGQHKDDLRVGDVSGEVVWGVGGPPLVRMCFSVEDDILFAAKNNGGR